MRPGARKRDIEVVASRFGLETAFPGRTGASVQSDPVSESAFLTDKTASGDASIVPAIGPFPVNKKAHARTLFQTLILDHRKTKISTPLRPPRVFPELRRPRA